MEMFSQCDILIT